jgi:hypothetical protein
MKFKINTRGIGAMVLSGGIVYYLGVPWLWIPYVFSIIGVTLRTD